MPVGDLSELLVYQFFKEVFRTFHFDSDLVIKISKAMQAVMFRISQNSGEENNKPLQLGIYSFYPPDDLIKPCGFFIVEKCNEKNARISNLPHEIKLYLYREE